MSSTIPPLVSPRYWMTWITLAVGYLLGRLPAPLRYRLGALLGDRVLAQRRKRREIANTNLLWCYPALNHPQREGLLANHYRYLGRAMVDYGLFWWAARRRFFREIEVEGIERITELVNSGGRVIVVTIHSHGMDFGGMAISAQVPMSTFANTMRDPLLEWLVSRRRARFGCTVHPRHGGIRAAVRDLKAGRVLFFPCDEDQGREHSQFVPLFGIDKATLTSPLRIAKLCGAHIVPSTTFFDEQLGRYRVVLLRPLAIESDSRPEVVLGEMNGAFEALIGMAPEQYLWTQRIFQTRPDGSPPPYTMKGKPGSGPRARPVQ